MNISPIAYISSPFKEKFGIPRQSGLAASVLSEIIFEEEYRNDDMLRGLEGFSLIWLVFGFSENEGKWSPTVRPPRLGGNKRMGVFATRSPFRPNSLGLSSVKIEEIRKEQGKGTVILVSGADLLDKTPIYDIKPYISLDCHPGASFGFQKDTADYCLDLDYSKEVLSLLPEELQMGLLEILKQDPRPSYQNDPERVYAFNYSGYEIKFTVNEGTVFLKDIKKSCID